MDLIAYKPVLTESFELVPGVYQFRAERRFRWLQRLCLWTLDRLGCQARERFVAYDTIEIDFKDVADLIAQQMDAIEHVTSELPKYIVLGRAQARDLKLWASGQLAFNMPLADIGEFFDATIVVAPYFDGVVCLKGLS